MELVKSLRNALTPITYIRRLGILANISYLSISEIKNGLINGNF